MFFFMMAPVKQIKRRSKRGTGLKGQPDILFSNVTAKGENGTILRRGTIKNHRLRT